MSVTKYTKVTVDAVLVCWDNMKKIFISINEITKIIKTYIYISAIIFLIWFADNNWKSRSKNTPPTDWEDQVKWQDGRMDEVGGTSKILTTLSANTTEKTLVELLKLKFFKN